MTEHRVCCRDALQDAIAMIRRLVAATDPYGLDADSTPFDAHTEFAAAIFAAKELLDRLDEDKR